MLTRELAISTLPAANLKRRYEAPSFDDADTENIDPAIFASPTKKYKVGLQHACQSPKPAEFPVNITTSTIKSVLARQIRSPRRSDLKSTRSQGINLVETPTTPTASITPNSAPAAAGRSPKSKRVGILSRRRMTSSPFMRVNPPSFPTNGIQGGLPLSLDAAISGTVPSYRASATPAKVVKPRQFRTIEESMPKGWGFDVFEESEDMQDQNIVIHRACNLDISDDESSKADIGKENIPPSDVLSAGLLEMSGSRNMIIDEPRTPLGDLEASNYYAEGCDASSYFLVDDDLIDMDVPNIDAAKADITSAPAIDIWESEVAEYDQSYYGFGHGAV